MVNAVQTTNGNITVEYTAPLGYYSELSQTSALLPPNPTPLPWNPIAGTSAYGLGQKVSTLVYVAPPPPGTPPPPAVPAQPNYDFVVQRLTGTNTSLVSWSDGGATYSAIVNLNFVIPGLNTFLWNSPVTTNPADIYNLSFMVFSVAYDPATSPPVTPILPPAQVTRLARLTGAYPFITANPVPPAPANQSNSSPLPGDMSFYRLKLTALDSDFDGISDPDEFAVGTNPFLADTDGDGISDLDEKNAGTSATNATEKPFDPYNPPKANLYVAPLSWWLENKFGTTLEALTTQNLTGEIANFTTRANTLSDGSYDLPYLSIQTAITNSTTGDVIEVAPGTYTGSLDLSNRDVKLIGQRGARETTKIVAPANSTQAILLGTGNTSATYVSGLTVTNASGSAILCQNSTQARLHNLVISGSTSGILVNAASPVIANVIVDGCNGTAATDAALRLTGSCDVKVAHATFADNVSSNTTSGQVQADGATAKLTLINSLVTSVANRAGGQITATNQAVVDVSYCGVRGGVTSSGNLTAGEGNLSAAEALNLGAGFDSRDIQGKMRRLTLTSPALDRGHPRPLPGLSLLTRRDSDGEGKGFRFGFTPAAVPEIVVEQPALANVTDGGSRSFGSTPLGTPVDLEFTIRNHGTAPLTGLTGITFDGTNASDFTVVATPSATLGAVSGALIKSTTFIVRFNPATLGAKTANLHLANNDADEGPFDITLTGTALVIGSAVVPPPALALSSTPPLPIPAVPLTPDIGADEYVSRLSFPTQTRNVPGLTGSVPSTSIFSEVDEASDVAYLGTLANGNARIAVINDETTASLVGGVLKERNEVMFYEISATTGDIVGTPTAFSINRANLSGTTDTTASKWSRNQMKDPEALAYDAASNRLYITTSMTRVNKYRDCEPTIYDNLVDPPINDYDPRRCQMVSLALNATTLLPIANSKTYLDNNDGVWQTILANRRDMNSYEKGDSTVSPVNYESPNGIIATLRANLDTVFALGTSTIGNSTGGGVLIALNTAPKFGEPVAGVTYQPGEALPYAMGGAGNTAGWVLFNPTATASSGFPYHTLDSLPATGLQVTGYQTATTGTVTNLTTNTTYYFKAWAYDAARTYSRGLEAQATTSADNPLKINEILAANGTDQVEFFNPSGIAVNLTTSALQAARIVGGYTPIPTTPVVTIPARSFYRMSAAINGGFTTTNLGFDLSNSAVDGVFTRAGAATNTLDDYIYARVPEISNTEGRVWDGGPRGKVINFAPVSTTGALLPPRFECTGALYRGTTGIQSTSLSSNVATTNQTQTQAPAKFFQATPNHVTQSGIFLHYANLGRLPKTSDYSPKQQDFHPISVEGLAMRNSSEIVVGLRSPLTNRTTGDAITFVFNNGLIANSWVGGVAPSLIGERDLNLNGQGIRSIQWCPLIKKPSDGAGPATGAYLIVGGPANGGPLKNETTRQVFSLYRWDTVNSTPVRVVGDLAPFAVRPEGINIITLNNERRVLFVEDRYQAQNYNTQNAAHWPLSALNLE